jgi:hypothetical protein
MFQKYLITPLRTEIFTIKMAVAILAETFINCNIRRDLTPKSEVVHWTPVVET